jgi:hypothetical protein
MGGNHDFKLGVQYNSGLGEYTRGRNDYIYHYGGIPEYGYTQLPYTQGGRMNGFGFYVDDTYSLGRATLNLGLRFDTSKAYFAPQDILNADGTPTGRQTEEVDELFRWNAWSPRLGITYKLTESGSTLLKAHYGRYYRGIVISEFDNVSPSLTPLNLFSGRYDANGNPIDAEPVIDLSQFSVDSDLSNPYTDQFIVAWEQQVGPTIGFSVNYVNKRSRNQTAYPDVGGTYVLVPYSAPSGANVPQVYQLTSGAASRHFELRNDDRMFADYDGLAFEIRKRMADRWQANFGMTFSVSEGRQGSSSARATPLTSQVSIASVAGVGFGQNPNDFINSDGRLTGDRPVVIKAQFIYQMPWNVTTSSNFQSQSGRPIYDEVRPPATLTRIPGTNRVVANFSDGELRTSHWNQLDMRAEKAFSLGGTFELAVFGDFLNLFNSDANESVIDRRIGNPSFLDPSRFILPRRLMIGAKARF